MPAGRSVELGAWLPGHIDDMLALPGFIEANRFDPVSDDQGCSVHTVQYVLSDRAALDEYLQTHAERMREDGRQRFGDDLDASRNVHAVVARSERPDARCLNCDVALDGQYCWNCGQRGNTRLISLMELIRDAVGDMFELDSRLWRTLLPLIRQPGYLTAEYLRGRRARYMPPFRMYLVLSFLFFLLTRSLGDNGATIDFDEGFNDGFNEGVAGAMSDQQRREVRDALDRKLADGELSQRQRTQIEGTLTMFGSPSRPDADGATDATAVSPPDSATATESAGADASGTSPDDDGSGFSCQVGVGDTGIGWLDQRLSDERIQAVCDDIASDNGRRFLDRIAQNTPVAALALLPLLALLLKLLYPLSRRYYVEHLLLLVHYHSFAFLAMSAVYVYNAVMDTITSAAWLTVIPNVVIGIYIPLYLYKAMRRVYQQGRFISIFKYLLLLGGYLSATLLVMVVMLLYILITY